jgi:hypothetical protein
MSALLFIFGCNFSPMGINYTNHFSVTHQGYINFQNFVGAVLIALNAFLKDVVGLKRWI